MNFYINFVILLNIKFNNTKMQSLYSTYNKQLWIANPEQQTWLETTPANLYDERLWPLSV